MRWPWGSSRSERLHPSGLPEAHDGAERVSSSSGRRSADRGRGHDTFRLVKVAYASNLAEGEMLEGLLRQEGIPSMLQPASGVSVAGGIFVNCGPRDVLVAETDAERARELLA